MVLQTNIMKPLEGGRYRIRTHVSGLEGQSDIQATLIALGRVCVFLGQGSMSGKLRQEFKQLLVHVFGVGRR